MIKILLNLIKEILENSNKYNCKITCPSDVVVSKNMESIGKNKDITNLKDVVEGTFYKDGELLIKNFTAEQVSAFRGSKRVEAKKAKAQISITSKRNKGIL